MSERDSLRCPKCDFSSNSEKGLVKHVRKSHGTTAVRCPWCVIVHYSSSPGDLCVHKVQQHRSVRLRCFLCEFSSRRLDRWTRHVNSAHSEQTSSLVSLVRWPGKSKSECVGADPVPGVGTLSNHGVQGQEENQSRWKRSSSHGVADSLLRKSGTPDCNNTADCVLVDSESPKHHSTADRVLVDSKSHKRHSTADCVLVDSKSPKHHSTADCVLEDSKPLKRHNIADCVLVDSKSHKHHITADCVLIKSNPSDHHNINDSDPVEIVNSYDHDKTGSCSTSLKTSIPTSSKFSCSLCGYSTSKEEKLRKHCERKHSGLTKEQSPDNSRAEIREPNEIRCPYCGVAFPKSKELSKHCRSEHAKDSLFRCTHCDYSCKFISTLIMHLRTHTGEKPYACHICSFKCAVQNTLVRHVRIHTNERPYKCHLCNYAAKESDHLKSHVRTHTNERPYKCCVCDYAAKTSACIKQHLRIHTGETPYQCKRCFRCFRQASNLKSHLKNAVCI